MPSYTFKNLYQQTSNRLNGNSKLDGSTVGPAASITHQKTESRDARDKEKRNVKMKSSVPVLQPINIINLNHTTFVGSSDATMTGDLSKPGSRLLRGSQIGNLTIRLKERQTSKAVATLTEILRAAAPATVLKTALEKDGAPVQIPTQSSTFLTSPKALKRVTAQLTRRRQANRIIAVLKTQPNPIPRPSSGSSANFPFRGVCLPSPDQESVSEVILVSQSDAQDEARDIMEARLNPSKGVINLITGLSVGNVLSTVAQTAGIFDALATCSGGMIERSEAHQNLIGLVPTDRVSAWTYWWGFEIALPPPTIAYLGTVKSISGTFLQLLAGLTVAGGIVELTPFIKYLSTYMDMEWKAITSQNQGRGVVLAATWALPLALIPREWDFDAVA